MITGCSREQSYIDGAMDLRNSLLKSKGCSFRALIYADYSDAIYEFTLDCEMDSSGSLRFSVASPDSISGICGIMDQTRSAIVFDDTVLAFPPLADGLITPVAAPWVVMKAMRGGYIHSCGTWEKGYQIQFDDTYEQAQAQVDVYTDADYIPVSAEILWRGSRILSLSIENFTFL